MSFTRKRFKVLGSLVLALMLSLSCITPAFAAETEPTWTQVASLSSGRYSYASEVVNGKIYIAGGVSDKGYVDTVEEYDPLTNVWTAKSPMPVLGLNFVSTVLDGKVYIIGGRNTALKSLDKMYIYNPATDTWVTKNLLTNRFQNQLETVGGKIYVIGGDNDSGATNSVEAYDPAADAWETKAPMKTSRTNFRTAVVNGKIYAIGGFIKNDPNTALSSVEEYDPVTNKWTEKASMHTPRFECGLSVFENKIYVIGGSNGKGATKAVEVYDPETNTWTDKAPILTPLYEIQTVVVKENIYAIDYNSAPEQYNTKTNTWKNIASMKSARRILKYAFTNNSIYAIGGHYDKSCLSSVEKYSLTSAPTVSTTLTATAGDAKVDLSWGAVSGATGYKVLRSTTSGGPYTQIATGVTATTYTDSTVTNGTTYYYVVTALNVAGESAYFNEASATPKKADAGNAILEIYMVDGALKEYDLSIDKVNAFIDWYDAKAAGTGKSYYVFEKNYNKGPFKTRKEYIVFDKIKDFQVNQYD